MIDVGHPNLEGKRADFKRDAGEHKDDADARKKVVGVGGEERGELAVVHALRGVRGERRVAGYTVEKNDAKQHER